MSVKQIKVCHIITGDIWGGAESQVISLLRSLKMEDYLTVSVVVFNHGILADKLIKEGLNIEIIDEATNNMIKMLLRIFVVAKREKPFIFHCHGYKETFLGGIVSKLLGIKLVRTHHGKGMLETDYFHKIIEWVNTKFLTNKEIAVSNELKTVIKQNGGNNKKISVIHNGLECRPDLETKCDADIYKKLIKQRNSIVIGTVGRLVPVKGQKYFLDAASIILKSKENITFLILGDGPLMDELKKYARDKNIENNIIFTGFRDNVHEYIKVMDIFVLPSLHEGVPLALLEAMCMKKAIIATDVGGISEVITHNVEGLLVKPADSIMLAKSATRLIEDSKIRMRLSRNAYKKLKNNFTIEKAALLTINEYKKLC